MLRREEVAIHSPYLHNEVAIGRELGSGGSESLSRHDEEGLPDRWGQRDHFLSATPTGSLSVINAPVLVMRAYP